jgi:hypothetical protein
MIDVPKDRFGSSATFWVAALGRTPSRAPSTADPYLTLLPGETGVRTTLQRVDDRPRMHLDLETDDVDAEVGRLQSHGAQVIERVLLVIHVQAVIQQPRHQRLYEMGKELQRWTTTL